MFKFSLALTFIVLSFFIGMYVNDNQPDPYRDFYACVTYNTRELVKASDIQMEIYKCDMALFNSLY